MGKGKKNTNVYIKKKKKKKNTKGVAELLCKKGKTMAALSDVSLETVLQMGGVFLTLLLGLAARICHKALPEPQSLICARRGNSLSVWSHGRVEYAILVP